ncbi:hypothetical protein [Streptomyces sp. 11-1-2]|uniref:hypothetical protein n=1 Tax=Streptomyces sp. 11-1-2 TaxID=1851167 RepID=UPI001F099809|nr:hypothetical protein [Streptomyces sp. 11-1-2]
MAGHIAAALCARGTADRQALRGDCKAFTDYSDYRDSGGLPQRKRDTAIGAARRLGWLERALAEFESDMAFDDRFVLADRRSAGEAFAGTVVEAEPGRTVTTDKNKRVPRPRVTSAPWIPCGWPPTPS